MSNEPLESTNQITNVSSVKHLSPFRYPGGKTWLVPQIKHWLQSTSATSKTFMEPFVGGGIVGLSVANQGWAKHVVMVEIDDFIAAVWNTALTGDVNWLMDRISKFKMTLEEVKAVLAKPPQSEAEQAFHTILRNRACHGGKMTEQAGFLKEGENGKGINSR